MSNVFNNFRLSKYLTNVDVITDINEQGETIEFEIFEITKGVSVYLFQSGQATLKIGDIKSIEFNYTEKIAEVFTNINYIPVPIMFEVLVKNQIK